MVAILLLLTILVMLTIDYYFVKRTAREGVAVPAPRQLATAPFALRVPPAVAAVPAGVFVSPGHAWMALQPTGHVTVGADAVPGALLGGFDSCEAVPAGQNVRRGERIATLRRGERTVDVASPVDGVVTEVNAVAETDPARVADSPFGEGWLVRVAPRRLQAALERLFVAEKAEEWMQRQLGELRDFLTGVSARGAFAGATLPDGGVPVNGIASLLSEDEWAELVGRFFAVRRPAAFIDPYDLPVDEN